MTIEAELAELDSDLETLDITCSWLPEEVATHYVRIVHECQIDLAPDGNPIQPACDDFVNNTEFLMINHLKVECRFCDYVSVVEDFVEILERI